MARLPDRVAASASISQVEGAGLAGPGDRFRGAGRNDAGGGLRARQRGLEIEHELQEVAMSSQTARMAALESMGASRGESDIMAVEWERHSLSY